MSDTIHDGANESSGTVLPVKWANATLKPDVATFRVLVAVNRPGTWAILDHRRFNELKQWDWKATADGYFWRATPTGPMWLHREIVDAMGHEFVAFRNGDRRDCRKMNLQLVATKEEAKGLVPLRKRSLKSSRSVRVGGRFKVKRAKVQSAWWRGLSDEAKAQWAEQARQRRLVVVERKRTLERQAAAVAAI